MIEAWSTSAVYAAEASLMATLDDGELMARAVEGLAGIAAARLVEHDGAAVVALVGHGNNGADALYAVARLAEAGWNAAAVHHDTVHEEARAAAEAAGVVLTTDPSVLAEADVVLDGILGIGARAGLPDWATAWVARVPDTAHVIAVDLPSGHDPMGGTLDPDGVFADETVTFSVPKPVHLLPPTEQACGVLTVVDIGIEVGGEPVVRRLDHDDVASRWPTPSSSDDKYSRGVLGVVAGGESYPGAAVLAVTGAVEAGAGMVRYVGTPTPTRLVAAAVPEAVHGVGRVQAWVVGPGLDAGARGDDASAQLDAARAALQRPEPVVVDAGGLDLLDVAVLGARRDAVTLLTPHAGECARLLTRLLPPESGSTKRSDTAQDGGSGSTNRSNLPQEPEAGSTNRSNLPQEPEAGSTNRSKMTQEPETRSPYWSIVSHGGEVTRDQVEAAPLEHARALARVTGATVLLKGSTTLVVGPGADATAFSQADAPAWTATAGAGDVLAGLAGTLLAAGLPADEAGALAALVHGVAADRANPGGPVRALRVAHGIPGAVAHLLGRGGTAAP